MSVIYPMLLSPAGKDYLWGGTRLRNEYGKNLPMTPLAETWECSVHPDGLSVVRNGSFAGRTLADVLALHPEFAGSDAPLGAQLPVLVKFIDAAQDLSIQVHPDHVFAERYEHDRGKDELWYVLDAAEGAEIVYGFEHPVSAPILREAVRTGEFAKHLHHVKVKKGDAFFIPAGTVHAVGAGILLAEIQENSNLTYRVYDYERVGADGRRRELHFEKAVRVMDMKPSGGVVKRPRVLRFFPGGSREVIGRCRAFTAEHVRCRGDFRMELTAESCRILLVLKGRGIVQDVRIGKGDCLFIPAGAGDVRISGELEFLKVRI